jgi:hypothetical protein
MVVATILTAAAAEIGVAERSSWATADVSAAPPRTPGPVELPREWRWERDPITFDPMFRQSERQ